MKIDRKNAVRLFLSFGLVVLATAALLLDFSKTLLTVDGKTRVHYFEGADLETIMHELLHVSMYDLSMASLPLMTPSTP